MVSLEKVSHTWIKEKLWIMSVFSNTSSCGITCWLKLVPCKCVSSKKFPLEVSVNVRGLIMDWMDCKDTSLSFQAAAASRQTLIRRPLHLAVTKSCSPVQPLYKNTLLEHCWDQTATQHNFILEINHSHMWKSDKSQHEYFKDQITECLTDLHQHINSVKKIC